MQVVTKLPVNEIYSSIQGEGFLSGVAMTILRLQGCAVGCAFCDTKQTWELSEALRVYSLEQANKRRAAYIELSPVEIARAIAIPDNEYYAQWVMLTGGEPAQYPLAELVDELHNRGKRVALETSGTETLGLISTRFDWVCISPKLNQKRAFNPASLPYADELKCVVESIEDIQRYEALVKTYKELLNESLVLSLQPVSIRRNNEDAISREALALCLNHLKESKAKWRISIQTHKLLNLP